MEMELFNGDITFTAPEILVTHKHGKPVDMWAIGVLLFIMYVTISVCNHPLVQRVWAGTVQAGK